MIRARIPTIMGVRAAAALVVVLVASACKAKDPKLDFEVKDVETYWAVDSPRGATQYIAPVVRFRVRNRTAGSLRLVEAQATFKRARQEDKWPSGLAVLATPKKPLAAGAEAVAEIKSDGRYSMRDTAPEAMLANEAFVDAEAEIFLREGNSSWTLVATAPIERRIGSKSAVIPVIPEAPPR